MRRRKFIAGLGGVAAWTEDEHHRHLPHETPYSSPMCRPRVLMIERWVAACASQPFDDTKGVAAANKRSEPGLRSHLAPHGQRLHWKRPSCNPPTDQRDEPRRPDDPFYCTGNMTCS
jgi:hypothetical protein